VYLACLCVARRQAAINHKKTTKARKIMENNVMTTVHKKIIVDEDGKPTEKPLNLAKKQ
jgi:hypothetical protein